MIIYAKTGKVISLGRVGDKDATTVRFDLTDWISQYGAGTVTGRYVLNNVIVDVAAQTVTTASPYFDWLISESVTTTAGVGRFSYTFNSASGSIQKISPYYDTLLTTSEYYDDDYSENYRTWLDTLNTLVIELTNKREEMEENVEASHDWAVGPEISWTEPSTTNNSKYYAETAQSEASSATSAKKFIEDLTIKEQIVDANASGIEVIKTKIDEGLSTEHWEYTFQIPVNNPMTIVKGYETIDEMNADWESTSVRAGQFVIIAGGEEVTENGETSVNKDEHYGEIYVKLSEKTTGQTPGWYMLVNIALAEAVRGPQGYSMNSITIAADGVVKVGLTSGETITATGDNFYTWVSEQKTDIDEKASDASDYKDMAVAASVLAAEWANYNDATILPSETNNAKYFSDTASTKASVATDKALLAESWAKGGTNTTEKIIREGEDTNNAKYWSEQSESYTDDAAASAVLSESWAIGGTESREGEDTNNSMYYAGLASSSATSASESATSSKDWAIGPTGTGTASDANNAMYWSNKAAEHNTTSKDYSEIASEYARGKKLDGTAVITGETGFQDNAYYYKELAASAKTDAESAKNLAVNAQSAAETAQGLAETAQGKAETAQGLAEAAKTSAESAKGAAETAKGAAESAQGKAETAQSKAEAAQSAAETAKGKAETAQGSAETSKTAAQTYAETSREYAEGKKLDGTEVVSGETGYENNAKYYAGLSSGSALAAAQSESNAGISESNAKLWANGGASATPSATNNSYYYSQQALVEKNRIANMTVSATKVDYTATTEEIQPSKSINPDGSLNIGFKIPQGIPGDKGETGNGIASFEALSAPHTPGTLDTYRMTFTDTSTTPFDMQVWNGSNGVNGEKGDTGNGIASVELIEGSHVAGTYDTYRMSWTDASKEVYDFKIWNGTNGTGSGTVSSVNNIEPVKGNVTLNKDNGNVALTSYFHIGDTSKSEDANTLYFDF